MITVYSYNVQGHYVGETIAREDPKNPGTYLLPARTTTDTPPATTTREIAVWDGNSWSIEVDWRGKWYDYVTQAVTEVFDVGVLAPEYTTDIPPPHPYWQFNGSVWERTLATAQEEKIREIHDAYYLAQTGTVTFNGKEYSLRDGFMLLLLSALSSQSGMIDVYDVNHNSFQIDQNEAGHLRDAIYSAGIQMVLNRETKLKAIDDATDVASVDAITW